MANYFPPRLSEDTKVFFENLKNHKMIYQKCNHCGNLRWPSAFLCPRCLSEEYSEYEVKGTGTINSIVKFIKPFSPSVADKAPYFVAQIDLDEGIRILGNILNDDAKIGDKVKVVYEDFEDYSKASFEVIK